jgi:hypothetical protein
LRPQRKPHLPSGFSNTTLPDAGVLAEVASCPNGYPPDQTDPCAGNAILPGGVMTIPPIPCSAPAGQPDGRGAVALEACSTSTTTLFDTGSLTGAKPLAVLAAGAPTWAPIPNSTSTARGYYVGLADGTVRLVSGGDTVIVAGQPGQPCTSSTAACGDGGPATSAQLGSPAGLAVGLDGALFVADSTLHRIRRIDPGNQTITTVAGTGQACSATDACGDGGLATAAALRGPDGVWADPSGILWIADDQRGIRAVAPDGRIASVGITPGAYTVRSVVGDGTGHLYAATNDPDYLFVVTPPAPPAPPVPICAQLPLAPGTLISVSGEAEVDIVDRACVRHHVPDPLTLQQIQATYQVDSTQIASTDWQAIPTGPAIPAASTNSVEFTQAMWQIFDPACARLVLAPGDLIQAIGSPEVDILDLTCQRRQVPDAATVAQIQATYSVPLISLPASDFQDLAAGSAIPSVSTDPSDYGQAMWAIFQPACFQLGLGLFPGDLILAIGNSEVDLVDVNCERRPVPDAATIAQIRSIYQGPVSQLREAAWQAIPAGSAIPSVSTDPAGFEQTMDQIFGPPCLLLALAPGSLITVTGNPEIDIVDRSCQCLPVPNPDTEHAIMHTYHVAVVSPVSETNWQRFPVGPTVPDADSDPSAFQHVMQQIFGTAATPRRAAVNVGGQATQIVGTGQSGYTALLTALATF